MLLGAYTALSATPGMEAAIEGREAAMEHRYDLETTYYSWRDRFPDFGEATIAAHHRIPVMAWYGPGKNRHAAPALGEIISGRDDAWITEQARAMAAYRRPVFLRLMPEMNGWWYQGYSGHPAGFIAAWRHVHTLFQRAGAANVIWVWCPNLGPSEWNSYYPGDQYVDVIGVDGFNNPDKEAPRTFAGMFGPFLAHFAGRKPLMIAETATATSAGGGPAAFISGMADYLKRVGGPRYGVVAVCWFDSDTTDSHNWTLSQTPAAWRAWLAMARDPYFGGHG
jgi:hypothetical protein